MSHNQSTCKIVTIFFPLDEQLHVFVFRHKTPHEALWVRVERCPPHCRHGTRPKPSAPLAYPCPCKYHTRGKFLFQSLVSCLLVVIVTRHPRFQAPVAESISVFDGERLFYMLLFVFRDSVNNLLEENQRYLSQLTSLLQETTEEKSESIMVSAFMQFLKVNSWNSYKFCIDHDTTYMLR